MGIIKIREGNLYIEEYGRFKDKCIIYLHGGPGTSCLDFRMQGILLGGKYHVISYDQRGVLRSDETPGNVEFNMMEHVKDLEEIRNKLNINKFILLGHSYGGKLAALYTRIYPDNVEAIIYDCPSLYSQLSFKSCAKYLLSYFEKKKDDDSVKICEHIIRNDYSNSEREIINDMFKILPRVSDNTVRNYLHNISGDEFEELYLRFSRENTTDNCGEKVQLHAQQILNDDKFYINYLEDIKKFKCKQYLLYGKYDPVCSKEEIKYFNKWVKNGKTIEFKNSGHFIRLEEPDLYNKTILDIINDI